MSTTTRPSRDKRSLDYAIRSGIAGGIAGCIAKTVVAPLDRVKILFQASNPDFQKYAGSWSGAYKAGRAIYRDGGVRGLLQGHSATLLRVFPYAGVNFMAFDLWKAFLMPDPAYENNVKRFAAGALAGLTSVTITYPLELIRVRMAFQSSGTTFLSAMRSIYHDNAWVEATPAASPSPSPSPSALTVPASTFLPRSTSLASTSIHIPTPPTSVPSPTPPSNLIPPIRTRTFQRFPLLRFYRGFSVTMLGIVPYAGTSFFTWDYLRAHYYPASTSPSSSLNNSPTKPSPFVNLAIGALAGALAQTAAYPFEVVRRRMQVARLGAREAVRAIWTGGASSAVNGVNSGTRGSGIGGNAGGWRGFYVGLGIGYVKMVPMTAVSFVVWQWMKGVLDV
ncbi:mitochondrial carrier domain-containing protein [Hygrophoropsis aurantiaca]|uniref:Mitochondrial carrier domain-containing protein n=1 Tax=Hygrophoropsis aurantiaca TaxID=72124 RepID=A0ACB8AJW7_9AGAM|nr:mitochondrial carrier domain-containing protein [Hygrophoropsis aurantiaca]